MSRSAERSGAAVWRLIARLLVLVLAVPFLFASVASADTVLDPGPSTQRLENTSSAIRYSGSWKTMTGGDSGGSISYLNGSGSASFTFVGSGFRWISRTSASAGQAKVYVDGAFVRVVDRYSSKTAYQVNVYENVRLTDARHTVKITWTGNRNSKATDRNLVIDAFDITADPLAIAGTTVMPLASGYAVSWDAPFSKDVQSYRVVRAKADGSDATIIGTTGAATRLYRDTKAGAGASVRYTIVAVDSKKVQTKTRVWEAVGSAAQDSRAFAAASSCPARTKSVSSASALTAALAAAKPGDVIQLAAGTYTGKFVLRHPAVSSTKDIWICGPSSAVLTTGSTSSGMALLLDSVENVHVVGITVKKALQGIHVVNSSNVELAKLTVSDIGYEAVHFRSQTTDSLLVSSTITRTGLVKATYGEGVYVGTSDRNWCNYNNCRADATARITVADNKISATGAQAIEAKEGTKDGEIVGNVVTGSANHSSDTDSLVMVTGNGWSVSGNRATSTPKYGIRIYPTEDGYGNDNVVTGNEVVKGPNAAVWVNVSASWSSWGIVVTCSNSGSNPLSNMRCTAG